MSELHFSPKDVKEFEQSSLWRVMLDELTAWENNILHELAAPTFNVQSGKMDFSPSERATYDEGLRGSLKAIGFAKSLPSMVAEALNQKEQTDAE